MTAKTAMETNETRIVVLVWSLKDENLKRDEAITISLQNWFAAGKSTTSLHKVEIALSAVSFKPVAPLLGCRKAHLSSRPAEKKSP